MNRIARYLIQTVIAGTLVALLVIMVLELVFSFIDEATSSLGEKLGLLQTLLLVLLEAPGVAYQAFPVATLIGALMGLGGLAARNELTAMRAAGVSLFGVARSVVLAGFVLGLVALALGEWAVPPAQRYAQALATYGGDGQIAAAGQSGFWARDGERFVQVERALNNARLLGVRIYELDQQGRVERIVLAQEAAHQEPQWLLREVIITRIGEAGVQVERLPELVWHSDLRPELLDVVVTDPGALPALGLYEYIRYLERSGLESDRYRLALWVKVATPLATIVMLLLTVPMVFGAVRSANAGQRIFVGMLIGLVFFLANRLLNHAALVYGFPPALAALAPTAVFFAVALVGIARTR